eukprot:351226-Chlamydomonas_euryale.AAC.4
MTGLMKGLMNLMLRRAGTKVLQRAIAQQPGAGNIVSRTCIHVLQYLVWPAFGMKLIRSRDRPCPSLTFPCRWPSAWSVLCHGWAALKVSSHLPHHT